MTEIEDILAPEIVYLQGNTLVPSKALNYKFSDDGAVVERVKPNTKKFEGDLKKTLRKELTGVKQFPTRNEVLVSIVHGIHAKDRYNECDLDNRAKLILDALKDVVYLDDSQVKMLWTHKAILQNSQESFFRLSIKILNPKVIDAISKRVNEIIGGKS